MTTSSNHSEDSTVADAQAHAALGHPVLPICGPVDGQCVCGRHHTGKDIGKAPLTDHGLTDATTDRTTIERWAEEFPGCNWAIDVARSGVVIADPDSDDAQAEVVELGVPPTPTRMSRWPAYVYARPAGCPQTNAIRVGRSGTLDVLGKGYLVVAGKHREGHAIYVDSLDVAPAPAPGWAVAILKERESERGARVRFTPDADAAAKGETRWATIRRQLPERIVQAVEAGPEAYRPPPPRDGAPRHHPPDASRSGADGSVVYYLIGLGLTDDEIRNLYQALPIGTRGKYRERGDDYLATTIRNQRAYVVKAARSVVSDPPGQSGNGHGEPPPPPTGGGGADEAPAQRPPAPDLDCTDMGNAVLFIGEYGARLRYCHPWKSWLDYDGVRWRADENGTAPALAKTAVRVRYRRARALLAEAETLAATDLGAAGKLAAAATAQVRWATQSANAARVQAMLTLAQSEPGVPVVPAEVNRDPWLLNVLNGTVDLRTGVLLPHRPDHLITKLAPVTFDPAATCPTFGAFVETLIGGNPALVDFLQRAIGYSLTGDTREQVLLILYGLGSNGKSTLIDLLHALLGDYAENTPFDTFLAKDRDGIRHELAKLFGARFVDASELDAGRRLAEGLVKSVTGNDPLTARFLFQNSFTFTPTFKLWFSCNHKPPIRGTDHAIWRRIRLIPFTVHFHKLEDGPAPEGALIADKTLPARLRAELPGILNWAITGCLTWQRDGLGLPAAVKQATAAYREEMDTLGDFLAERCVEDPQAWVAASALYTAYTAWCESSGERPSSTTALGLRLRERGFTDGRVGKPQVRGWQGLRLRGPDER